MDDHSGVGPLQADAADGAWEKVEKNRRRTMKRMMSVTSERHLLWNRWQRNPTARKVKPVKEVFHAMPRSRTSGTKRKMCPTHTGPEYRYPDSDGAFWAARRSGVGSEDSHRSGISGFYPKGKSRRKGNAQADTDYQHSL